jgi:hypothetical protein
MQYTEKQILLPCSGAWFEVKTRECKVETVFRRSYLLLEQIL